MADIKITYYGKTSDKKRGKTCWVCLKFPVEMPATLNKMLEAFSVAEDLSSAVACEGRVVSFVSGDAVKSCDSMFMRALAAGLRANASKHQLFLIQCNANSEDLKAQLRDSPNAFFSYLQLSLRENVTHDPMLYESLESEAPSGPCCCM